jgi:hypothetical protein
MVQFHPPDMPPQFSRAVLAGEKCVWQALLAAPLGDGVHVFYNRRPKGSRRAPDILVLNPQRGVINIEVKGGQVHFSHGSFRQKIPTHRKKIDPWMQAKLALRDLFKALGVNADSIPHAVVLAAPLMHRTAYTFGASPHIITADDLAPEVLTAKILALLPVIEAADQHRMAANFEIIRASLTRAADSASP